MKENQNEKEFMYCCLVKIHQSESSFFLVTLFVKNQSIRIQHFLNKNGLTFLNHYLNNVHQKRFVFPSSYSSGKKKKIQLIFFGEINVDFYFFDNFSDVYVVQNRVL